MDSTFSDADMMRVIDMILDAHPDAGLTGTGALNAKGRELAEALLEAVRTHITPSPDTGGH